MATPITTSQWIKGEGASHEGVFWFQQYKCKHAAIYLALTASTFKWKNYAFYLMAFIVSRKLLEI